MRCWHEQARSAYSTRFSATWRCLTSYGTSTRLKPCMRRYGLGQIFYRQEKWEQAVFHFRSSIKVCHQMIGYR